MPRWSRTSSDGRGSSALNCSKHPPCLPLRPPNRNFVVPDHRHFPSVAMGEPLPLCAPAEKSPRLSTHVHRFHTQISHSSLRVNRNHAYNGQNSPPRSRPSSAEAHWEHIVVRRFADTAGQAGSGNPVETPSPVAHHALRYGHGGHLDGCLGGPSRGAEMPGTTACGQTAHEKSDAALHPIHCVTVMAATWTDAPADHREGRRSPARGPVARRRARKVMRHCIPYIAFTARRSRSGSLCSGHATGSASRWCRLSLRERTKLSRSERRLISPRRFPTPPLNPRAWSARRPRFWARRSRPGISWSRSRRCA